MKFLERLFVFAILSIIIMYSIGGSGCAMILPPSGGPKDTIPPVLVSAVPKDLSLNFNTNRVVFTFDEYVTLDRVQENLLVSPTPRINPIVDNKLRTVTLRLKDTLRANTTYEFDFGNAIRDVNEGNILRNFTYVFSTGRYVDSLQFSGRVLIAKTGRADSTLIVILHKNLDDSAVINERPRYVTRVDSAGYFSFSHLAGGTYAAYALKDESNNRKYFSKSQLFAFADNPVDIQKETPSITLYAYEEEAEIRKPNKPAAVKAPTKSEKEKDKRLVLKTNLSEGRLDILGNLEFHFGTQLKDFDSTKWRFTDEQYKDITNYRLIRDKDTTHKTIELVYKWEPDTKYNIIAQKDFAQDSAGRMLLRTDTIPFRTKKESDYGELSLHFLNINVSRNPVLQLSQGDEIKYSYPLVSRDFKRPLFLPGDYKVTILYDDNQNGVWNPGEFFGKHKQPEKVQRVNFNNKKNMLTVKSAWENDIDITL
jgi:hypothetical protein